MDSCIVDSTSSPSFRNQSTPFLKKHRKLSKDLQASIAEIEKDYKNACDAARPPKRKLHKDIKEVWKYSIPCSDLKRSARKAFRVIGIFLEDEQPEKKRTLYLMLFYFKGDKAEFTSDELEQAVKFLQGHIDKIVAASKEDIPVAELPEGNPDT